jgi:hypothetical protein
MPKRQDPNHPMAAAAAAENAEIDKMVTAPPTPDPAPAPAALVPDPTSRPDPPPPPTPAPPEDRFALLERRFDSMAGRFEATLNENRELQTTLKTHQDNAAFAARTAADDRARREQVEADNAALLKEKRRLEQQLEAERLGREFKSDVVDADQFNDIVRGIQPHLQRRDDRIDELVGEVTSLRTKMAAIEGEAEKRVNGVRKEVTERLLLRDEPDFKVLLERKDFQDFLSERIPGARRTRLQEVQDAYNEGDTTFMHSVAEEFRKRQTPPPAPGAQPPGRQIADQTPRAPVPEKPVTEDDIAVAYGQLLRNEITPAQYRSVRKRQRDQELAAAR